MTSRCSCRVPVSDDIDTRSEFESTPAENDLGQYSNKHLLKLCDDDKLRILLNS